MANYLYVFNGLIEVYCDTLEAAQKLYDSEHNIIWILFSEPYIKNKEGLVGAFTVWIDLYNLKQHLVHQLNQAAESSPVKGYLQDGTLSHEGFVANGLKYVDRLGFSRQNLQGR